MKEEVFIQNGFEKVTVSAEESGSNEFYYYSLEVGSMTLLSTPNDESMKGWGCSLFDHACMITDENDLLSLIAILNRAFATSELPEIPFY